MFLEVCHGTIYWSTSTHPGPVTDDCYFLNEYINSISLLLESYIQSSDFSLTPAIIQLQLERNIREFSDNQITAFHQGNISYQS